SGTVRERRVYYTRPVGIEETLRDAILELARDAGMPPPNPKKSSAASVWGSFPAAGRDELLDGGTTAGGLIVGTLLVTPAEERRQSGKNDEVLEEPAALRERVREEVMFRPLATSTDLPGGWRVPIRERAMIHAVVETVYPGAVADWAAQRKGKLDVTSLKK